ncbi:MAG: rRNA maturation RNase YbeY [Thermodesulfobacteriota bacterium]
MRILITDERPAPEGGAAGADGAGAVIKKMARVVLEELGLDDSELSLLLTDNDGIRVLNREFRRIDRPTDVLSFPMGEGGMLGDVVISIEKARAQADEFGVTLAEELARLLVHGILHLVGHDHTAGGTQARRMKEVERELLGVLREKGCI